MQIAIDGPAGAGKSTVAKTLAQILNFIYVDTGAMYRALTWRALELGTDFSDETALVGLAQDTNIDFAYVDGQQVVCCNGVEIETAIRSPQVSGAVSALAAIPGLREVMVVKQRTIASGRDVVMDGRDIGEIVLPLADYKFFITADLTARSHRRYLDLLAQGHRVEEAMVAHDMEERDRRDAERPVGALKELPDSIVIDTTDLSIDEVLAKIKQEMGLA